MGLKDKEAAGERELSDGSSSSSSTAGFSYKGFRPRKKQARRRQDAGRRYQGGLIYDSELGVTCHFCRQKTVQKHVLCRLCVIAFCRRCLKNRHGEDIDIELADDDDCWLCPKCRGGCGAGCKNCCNCGPCRKKQNLKPPKISFAELRARGLDNAHDFLVHLETGESPESISARKQGKGWCKGSGVASNATKSSPNANIRQKTRCDEVPINKMKEKLQQFDDVRVHGNTGQGAFHTHRESPIKASKIEDANKTQGIDYKGKTTEKKYDSFPAFLRPREAFKDNLEARLAEPFDYAELNDLWEKIRCRKPVCKTLETRHGTSSFPTKESGSSYVDHHPDLAFKLTSTSKQEDKLKLLRGFFFWLEHASTSGAFKPWKGDEKDEECLEIDGPDCEVLGVLLTVKEDQKTSNTTCDGEDQEGIKPKIRRNFVENSSSPTKFSFDWDQEDIKPKLKEDSTRASSFNPHKRVKEEHVP